MFVSKDVIKKRLWLLKIRSRFNIPIHTITSDKGKEFAEHKRISDALKIDYYFARLYHGWERGANENLNGLIRQYIPKKTYFSKLTDEFIQEVENNLNNRPRKRFNFVSPNQFFNDNFLNNKVAFVTRIRH